MSDPVYFVRYPSLMPTHIAYTIWLTHAEKGEHISEGLEISWGNRWGIHILEYVWNLFKIAVIVHRGKKGTGLRWFMYKINEFFFASGRLYIWRKRDILVATKIVLWGCAPQFANLRSSWKFIQNIRFASCQRSCGKLPILDYRSTTINPQLVVMVWPCFIPQMITSSGSISMHGCSPTHFCHSIHGTSRGRSRGGSRLDTGESLRLLVPIFCAHWSLGEE